MEKTYVFRNLIIIRIERLSKYIILISECWDTKNQMYSKQIQNKFESYLSFITGFLYRELYSHARTPYEQSLIELCLTQIMTYLIQINIISNTQMNRKNSATGQTGEIFSASFTFFNNVLRIDDIPLITLQEALEIKVNLSIQKN